MTATLVDPRTDPAWAELALGAGSLFVSPPWLRTLAGTYGFELRAAISAGDGALGAIPFALVDDVLGRRVVSLPFSDFCDPILAPGAAWGELAGTLLGHGCPVSLRCLHAQAPAADPGFSRAGELIWHRIDLRRDPEAAWAALGGSARRNVRHARGAGVRVRIASDLDAVGRFHALHRRVRSRKYRLLAQPASFFERLVEEFAPGGSLLVLLAEVEGTAVAGILFLAWGDTLYYKFNASLAERLETRPNDLLLWEGMRVGRELGLAWVDLGVSDAGQDGLVRYKRKFATEEKRVVRLEHLPEGYVDRRGETRRMLATVTDLLVDERVPDDVRERAAEAFYRYFC